MLNLVMAIAIAPLRNARGSPEKLIDQRSHDTLVAVLDLSDEKYQGLARQRAFPSFPCDLEPLADGPLEHRADNCFDVGSTGVRLATRADRFERRN